MGYWMSQESRELHRREGKGGRGFKSPDKGSTQLGTEELKDR